MYLDTQRDLWPKLAKQKVFPANTPENVARFANDFRARFATGKVAALSPLNTPEGCSLGAVYVRYSADTSNPRSLVQQLRNCLETARRHDVFVLWEWVFADAAVTGTIACRHGYQAAKSVIGSKEAPVSVLFIDEVGRAARNTIETLLLGRLIEETRRRLVGASDGFDSATQSSRTLLGVHALLHEQFVDQLRSKVERGQGDAFDQGLNINGPAFGYKLVPQTNENGYPKIKANGKKARIRK